MTSDRYSDITARMGERREAAADTATAERERREDAALYRPHRFVDGPVVDFCAACRVNRRVHGGGEL